ncbi:class I SAM-dependent methyltransferase [Microbacterium terrisoli]|uniref:class I SAM-dependent methyltransferase n=1 Tax=Microbacterium terrisoli TaxID=3242192 RepID=UPI00280561C0|nr:methyltransferase domain-containing protein [Microbacterium protaetiae]
MVETATGRALASKSAQFDLSRRRLQITDKRGQWLAMTKWDRLGPVLGGSSDDVASRLVASGARLADDMKAWGYPLYLVGGMLLGMVRGGKLLPHDDDIDFAFLSDATDPAELGRISYEMERRLSAAGYTVVRHSLAHLELVFFDAQGQVDHYIDIFTGFFHKGLYCQPFALRGSEVTREDLVPTKDIVIGGVPLPAPANPEAWLAYAYGESWRIPDPTFKFVVDPGTKHRFDSWFGVFNRGRFFWEKHWQGEERSLGSTAGARAVARMKKKLPAGSHVLDLGCGDGRWGQELAAAGHTVVGVDFSFEALRVATSNDEHGVRYERVNANDRAALLALGTDLLASGARWHVLISDVLHGLTFANRMNVYLLLKLLLTPGMRAVVSFDSHRSSRYERADPRTWDYGLDKFDEELAESGLAAQRVRTRLRKSEVGWRRYVTAEIVAVPSRSIGQAWTTERPENVS